ncbi:hypothetical protein GALL_430580 [mine drainage metagenome]|uniref:Uncharacterized protein n=1 Tax=mine drainage metagenome TaxID=410659 RepID=A0A1J5PW00_9ZZZZ
MSISGLFGACSGEQSRRSGNSLSTGNSTRPLPDHFLMPLNVRRMTKPEWFEETGDFQSKPSTDGAQRSGSGIPRIAKRLAVIGATGIFAATGVAFAASTLTGAANAVTTTPSPTASATSTPAPTASPAATPDPTTPPTSASASPAVGNGMQPSIAGGAFGDDQEMGDDNQGDDDQGDYNQVGNQSNDANMNAQFGINQDGQDGNGDDNSSDD